MRSSPFARDLVLALHCSASTGRQWRSLASRLDHRAEMLAPDLFAEGAGAQPDLAAAAQPWIAAIDRHDGPVHLVGHSYGGAMALLIAARRPDRIASLSLYEPTAFHVLREIGADGLWPLVEIAEVARKVGTDAVAGDLAGAARHFVDYWGGLGTWAALSEAQRTPVAEYMLRAAGDFAALFEERTPLSTYESFGFPVLLMRGQDSPQAARAVTGELDKRMAKATLVSVVGAGHMGPITHRETVADAIARHIKQILMPAMRLAA